MARLAGDEPGRRDDHDERVRDEQADDEREHHRDAEAGPGRAADGGDDQDLRARLGADPVDHPDAEGGPRRRTSSSRAARRAHGRGASPGTAASRSGRESKTSIQRLRSRNSVP